LGTRLKEVDKMTSLLPINIFLKYACMGNSGAVKKRKIGKK
jgi:hypothetical protein